MGVSSSSFGRRLALVLGLAVLVAFCDHRTGTELRFAPFYFVPISLAAHWFGQRSALLVSALCTVLWFISNLLSGVRYSSDWIWVWNTAAEASAFFFVAALVARLGEALMQEHASARKDVLTGLPNARAFHEQAPPLVALCRRDAYPVAFAFIDLDNFKEVNDTHGHARGDTILRIAAKTMLSTLRESDLVARFGGDESVALLPNSTPETTSEVLERLRQTIETRMKAEGCRVTASIGAVVCPHAPDNMKVLLHAADNLMYDVKNAGKNRICITELSPAPHDDSLPFSLYSTPKMA